MNSRNISSLRMLIIFLRCTTYTLVTAALLLADWRHSLGPNIGPGRAQAGPKLTNGAVAWRGAAPSPNGWCVDPPGVERRRGSVSRTEPRAEWVNTPYHVRCPANPTHLKSSDATRLERPVANGVPVYRLASRTTLGTRGNVTLFLVPLLYQS